MAKKDKKSSKERAEERKAKNNEVINNYKLINDIDGVKTEVLQIRELGCIVRETSKNGISSVFVPDVKTKKKGVNQVLVKDTAEMRAKKKAKRDEAKAKKAKSSKKSKK